MTIESTAARFLLSIDRMEKENGPGPTTLATASLVIFIGIALLILLSIKRDFFSTKPK